MALPNLAWLAKGHIENWLQRQNWDTWYPNPTQQQTTLIFTSQNCIPNYRGENIGAGFKAGEQNKRKNRAQ